jgi:hypothetical protein
LHRLFSFETVRFSLNKDVKMKKFCAEIVVYKILKNKVLGLLQGSLPFLEVS